MNHAHLARLFCFLLSVFCVPICRADLVVYYTATDFGLASNAVTTVTQRPISRGDASSLIFLAPTTRRPDVFTNGTAIFSNTVPGFAYQIGFQTIYGTTYHTNYYTNALSGYWNGVYFRGVPIEFASDGSLRIFAWYSPPELAGLLNSAVPVKGVAAGTNIVVVTNGSLVTIHSTASGTGGGAGAFNPAQFETGMDGTNIVDGATVTNMQTYSESVKAMDSQLRWLLSAGSATQGPVPRPVIDWENQQQFDENDRLSIDWGARQLVRGGITPIVTLDWNLKTFPEGWDGNGMTNVQATNITGTLPDAVFPAVLPPIDGSQLTGIASGGGSASNAVSLVRTNGGIIGGDTRVLDFLGFNGTSNGNGTVTIRGDFIGSTQGMHSGTLTLGNPTGNRVIRIVPNQTNVASGNATWTFEQTIGNQSTNREIIYIEAINHENGAIQDTNKHAWRSVRELNWDPFDPSGFRQMEIYREFIDRTTGNTVRYQGEVLRDGQIDQSLYARRWSIGHPDVVNVYGVDVLLTSNLTGQAAVSVSGNINSVGNSGAPGRLTASGVAGIGGGELLLNNPANTFSLLFAGDGINYGYSGSALIWPDRLAELRFLGTNVTVFHTNTVFLGSSNDFKGLSVNGKRVVRTDDTLIGDVSATFESDGSTAVTISSAFTTDAELAAAITAAIGTFPWRTNQLTTNVVGAPIIGNLLYSGTSIWTNGTAGVGVTNHPDGRLRASASITAPSLIGALTGNADTATTLATPRTIGNVSFNGSANIVPETVAVIDSTDSTSFPLMVDSATGSLQPKTDAGLTYNASSGLLTATSYAGAGDVLTFDNEVYSSSSWNGNLTAPTKDAVRDKIESLSIGATDPRFVTTAGGVTSSSNLLSAGLHSGGFSNRGVFIVTRSFTNVFNWTNGMSEIAFSTNANHWFTNWGTPSAGQSITVTGTNTDTSNHEWFLPFIFFSPADKLSHTSFTALASSPFEIRFKYNGAEYSSVDVSGPNNTNLVNLALGNGSSLTNTGSFTNHSDVAAGALAQGNVVVYNDSTGKWENKSPGVLSNVVVQADSIQGLATQTVLGRGTAGNGNAEVLTLSGLTISGGVLTAAGGGVGVTYGTNGVAMTTNSGVVSVQFTGSNVVTHLQTNNGAATVGAALTVNGAISGPGNTSFSVTNLNYVKMRNSSFNVVRSDGTESLAISLNGGAHSAIDWDMLSITADGAGLTNAVDLVAGANITVTPNATRRSWQIDATGSLAAAPFTNAPIGYGGYLGTATNVLEIGGIGIVARQGGSGGASAVLMSTNGTTIFSNVVRVANGLKDTGDVQRLQFGSSTKVLNDGGNTILEGQSSGSGNTTMTSHGGTASVGVSDTATITLVGSVSGGTIDAANTTLKMKGYITLASPMNCDQTGAIMQTNDITKSYFGQVLFSNSADQTANYAEYRITVPEDIDTAVEIKCARLKFRLGGADTGTHRYVLSMVSVADSSAYTGTVGNAVNLDFAGDGSGADGDVETVGAGTTLTSWKSNVTAGQLWVIRLARDGNDATDASTVNSYSGPLVLEYGITQ